MAKVAAAPRLAIVGSDSLIGRELRDILSEGRLAETLDLFGEQDTGEATASTEGDSGDTVLAPVRAEALAKCRLVLLAGSRKSCQRVAGMKLTARLLDLTGTLAGEPGAVLRAPMAEPERFLVPEARITVVAHPAAIMVAMILRRIRQTATIRQAVITIFEPASQRGLAGVEELQKQTVGLLSFQGVPKAVFDEQLGFNLLSRLGEDATEPLAESEARIESDLAHLLAAEPSSSMPSIRLVQAPTFHGYVASAWLDFAGKPDTARLSAFLKSPQIDVRSGDEESPTNSGMAGQSGIALDALVPDAACPTAVWLWMVTDNMRLLAENGILAAAGILEQSGRPVQ